MAPRGFVLFLFCALVCLFASSGNGDTLDNYYEGANSVDRDSFYAPPGLQFTTHQRAEMDCTMAFLNIIRNNLSLSGLFLDQKTQGFFRTKLKEPLLIMVIWFSEKWFHSLHFCCKWAKTTHIHKSSPLNCYILCILNNFGKVYL